jgi:poly(3-hydroxybutyrate) depolymerase
MHLPSHFAAILPFVVLGAPAWAQGETPELQRRTWQVDAIEREALVHVPVAAVDEPVPLVFVFHGHGGNGLAAARGFRLHREWPEAIVVYPQGLATSTARDPDGERSGWQPRKDANDDRDLRFVDTMLASLRRELRVDPHHIHATGHSNGGAFVYLLWAERGESLASLAPSAATAGGKLRDATPPPHPLLHIAGRNDTVVPFAKQMRTVDALLQARSADPTGTAWDKVPGAIVHTATDAAPIATLLHPGDHTFPGAAPAVIAAFFRATPRPQPWATAAVHAPNVVQHVYASPAAGTEVSYHVYVPSQYIDDATLRVPVVYWLHGSGGGLPGIAEVSGAIDTAIASGALPPVLVVFPNGLPHGMWCDSANGRQPVETIFLRELVPRIDRQFRTVATRRGRVLAGFSMGGYGALRLGMQHHDRFATVASLGGGPLQPELIATPRANESRRQFVLREVFGDDMARFRAASPWLLAEQNAPQLVDSRLLLAIGAADETLPANRALHDRLQQLQIRHDYHELAGVGHDAKATIAALGDRLWSFLRAGLARD